MLPFSADRSANSGVDASPYVRLRPEHTLLYQFVEEYYPAFKGIDAAGTALLGKVEQEFEEYLKCGRLENGFLSVCCNRCHTTTAT